MVTAPKLRRVAGGLVPAIALALACTPAAHAAKAAGLPAAPTIIAGHLKATGGEKAHRAVRNRVTEGTVVFPAISVDGTFTLYEAAPNLRYRTMSMTSFGTGIEGTDGTVVWEIQSSTGAKVKEGTEQQRLLRQWAFDPCLDWKRLYKSAECTGRDTVEGRVAYRVVMTPASGDPDVWYFDTTTGILVRTVTIVEGVTGPVPVSFDLDDYRPVGGTKVPYRITMTRMGAPLVMTATDIKHNVDMTGRFDIPQPVRDVMPTPAGGK